jgi:hypothetical protein
VQCIGNRIGLLMANLRIHAFFLSHVHLPFIALLLARQAAEEYAQLILACALSLSSEMRLYCRAPGCRLMFAGACHCAGLPHLGLGCGGARPGGAGRGSYVAPHLERQVLAGSAACRGLSPRPFGLLQMQLVD